MKLKALASALWMGAKRHSPEILVGLGIAGAASSVIFAIKATPKAMILLEEKRQELGVEKLEAKEIIKTAAPVYIPTAVSFGVSVACIIGASSVNARRNAALTAAYTLSESTLRTYRDKVLETVGEDKEREIRQAAAIEQQQKTPETQTVVVNHAAGQLKCFDSLSGRYFTATKNQIDKAVNEFNRQLRDDMRISLNEWYDMIGLDQNKLGDMLGWDIDRGYIETCYASRLDEEGITAMIGLDKICFWLMAAMPWIMLACLFTDRERLTNKRYWWYLPPSILSLLTAIAVGLPQIVDKWFGGFGCWCTLIFTFICAYHDEMEGHENLHSKLICLSMICVVFAMICWCVSCL